MPRSLLESLDPRPTTLSILHKTFNHDPATLLADLAPAMMNPKVLARTGTKAITGKEEGPSALLALPVPEGEESTSLLRGYSATSPSSLNPRSRRRRLRTTLSSSTHSQPPSKPPSIPPSELNRQSHEILQDKQNIAVRREILNKEIVGVEEKIRALEEVKARLEKELLGLREEELELEDELEGVLSNLTRPSGTSSAGQTSTINTRRKKGPVYLPAEHDALPSHVAFTTINYPDPIVALDLSAPYDLLLASASSSTSQPGPSSSSSSFSLSLHSLKTGRHLTYLRGHTAPVRTLQVEDRIAVTGGEDGSIRVWDLTALEESASKDMTPESRQNHEDSMMDEFGQMRGDPSESRTEGQNSITGCLLSLGAHSRSVTSLYFEASTLVTSALDKTIRQWDLSTGKCVLTVDTLYSSLDETRTRMSMGKSRTRGSLAPRSSLGLSGAISDGLAASSMGDMEANYVKALQSWGYALISGSADGVVRMWDMRTGQTHRTLTGHMGPINVLQFDETHVVTGSADKTIKIWDLRTGGVSETLSAEHAITDLQFDTRKIVYCCGENSIKNFNRITTQTASLTLGGHTKSATKLCYVDRYMVSGGMDAKVKVWAL